jgi:hypothetical protein
MIRPGWKVYASDGAEVGSVDEVAGDENADIFDGLAVATSRLGKPVYVPSESVGPIAEGRVDLTLTAEQVGELGEYLEPATSRIIEADNKPGSRISTDIHAAESEMFLPIKHEKSASLLRRLSLLVKRQRG